MSEQNGIRHNWLYSVINAEAPVEVSKGTEWLMCIYLTGYCKNCGLGFSSPIPHTNTYVEAPMHVPLEGCIAPEFPKTLSV